MEPAPRLNAHEARVLGVLVEKELTTPEQYPLSLNAIVVGSNQKSNRDPVTDFSEAEIVVALQGLVAKHLAGRTMPAGGRVEKFRHTAREALSLSVAESAVLAELLMRGPQQPGELRARASRMSPLPGQGELEAALASLSAKGLAANLGRKSGERAERWGETLAPDARPAAAFQAAPTPVLPATAPAAKDPSLDQRVAALEERVASLERALEGLGG